MFNLDTLEKFQRVWNLLSEAERDAYVEQGILNTFMDVRIYLNVLGGIYTGKVDARKIYVFGTENRPDMVLSEPGEGWRSIEDIAPQKVYQVIGAGLQVEPRCVQLLIELNGGKMPQILPPQTPATDGGQPNS